MMEIVLRQQAIAAGLTRYFTGKPCKHGHIAERNVVSRICSACNALEGKKQHAKNRERNLKQMLVYREKNRDKLAEYSRNWYHAHKDEATDRRKRYVEENRETVLASQRARYYKSHEKNLATAKKYRDRTRDSRLIKHREWYKSNRDKKLAADRAYIAANRDAVSERRRRYNQANKDKIRAFSLNYKENNPEYNRITRQKRRRAVIRATPIWFSEIDNFVLEEAAILCVIREQSTGLKWNIDHMLPLQNKMVCGLHCWNNFAVIPASINLSKSHHRLHLRTNDWLHDKRFYK